MIEKRFRLGYVCGDFGLIDNDKWIDLHSMSENSEKNVKLCINKMNELAEENEHLKKELQSLRRKDIKDKVAKRDYTSMRLYDNKTEKENEQLKQLLDYADDLIQSHLSEHYIRQWRNFKTGHKEYNDFWEEKLKKHKELKEGF